MRKATDLTATFVLLAGGLACGIDGSPGGMSDGNTTRDGSTANQPPVAVLAYEIELNVWVPVNEGDTVVRPLNADINWDACASFDPDGEVVRIRLENGLSSQLLNQTVACAEHTESNDDPRADYPAYLLVTDNDGAEARLDFIYRTE